MRSLSTGATLSLQTLCAQVDALFEEKFNPKPIKKVPFLEPVKHVKESIQKRESISQARVNKVFSRKPRIVFLVPSKRRVISIPKKKLRSKFVVHSLSTRRRVVLCRYCHR